MEQKILFLINRQWTNGGLDLFMAGITNFAVWTPGLIALGLALLILGGFRARAFLVVMALLLGVSDGLLAKNLKSLVQRPRPHEVLAEVRLVELTRTQPAFLGLFKQTRVKSSRLQPEKDAGGRSFPSAHTMNMFCAATVATAFFRRRGWMAFVLAAAVGYSRVYTGSHWPGDVLASALLGIATALLGLCALEQLWRRAGEKWTPTLFSAHPSLIGVAAR